MWERDTRNNKKGRALGKVILLGLTHFYLVLLVFTTYLSAWALMCLWQT
jgi:hypothetical protein